MIQDVIKQTLILKGLSTASLCGQMGFSVETMTYNLSCNIK